ncbi:MAG TPA: carotenoid biosynthesis protein [Candidatus Angelobacter sp.]
MTAPSDTAAQKQRGPQLALWLLLALYAAANVLPLFPHAFPPPWYAASQILPAVLFAMIHGAIAYRPRGILAFAAISLGVGYLMEAIGVRTGFPFGHYYFTDGMGPKLFLVPMLMGPAYLGIGFIAWAVAKVILSASNSSDELAGTRLVTLPLAASFIMVAWDLSMDPALSTVGHYWIWTRGGAYFGVPVTNFLGWYLTNYLIYQLFAIFHRRRFEATNPPQFAHQRLAVLFYAVCAAGSVLRVIPTSAPSAVADPTGTVWRVGDINDVCALAAMFIMGAFVTLALARLAGRASDFRLRREDRYQASLTAVPRRDEVEQVR